MQPSIPESRIEERVPPKGLLWARSGFGFEYEYEYEYEYDQEPRA